MNIVGLGGGRYRIFLSENVNSYGLSFFVHTKKTLPIPALHWSAPRLVPSITEEAKSRGTSLSYNHLHHIAKLPVLPVASTKATFTKIYRQKTEVKQYRPISGLYRPKLSQTLS